MTYKSDGSASTCPSTSDTWNVKDFDGADLPAIPDGADDYMKNGAGKGPGLSGPGSQNAGGASTSSAAGALQVPGSGKAGLICGAVVFISTPFRRQLVVES